MMSVFRNSLTAFVALTYHHAIALNVHGEIPSATLQANVESQATVKKSNAAGYEKMIQVDANEKLFLHWNLNDDELDVRVVYKGIAWLGFGISSDGSLESAEAIIGKPDKPQRNQVRKYRFAGDKWTQAMKMGVGFQTLKDRSLVQDETSTTLSFKKPLKEDFEEITSVNQNGMNHFVLAVGEENLFSNPQQSYALTMNFSDRKKQDSDEESTAKETKNKEGKFSANKIPSVGQNHYSSKHVYILTASLVGGVSLLTLMVGSLTMAEQRQQEGMRRNMERDSDNVFYQI